MSKKISKMMWEHIKEQKREKLADKEALVLEGKVKALNKKNGATLREYSKALKQIVEIDIKIRDLRNKLTIPKTESDAIQLNSNFFNNGKLDVVEFKVDRTSLPYLLRSSPLFEQLDRDFNKLMLDVELEGSDNARALIEAFLK